MSCEVEMPHIQKEGAPAKELLDRRVLFIVWDSEDKIYSTIMVADKDSVIWFDSDGWIGKSSMDHFKEDRYQVIRPYSKGERLVVTQA